MNIVFGIYLKLLVVLEAEDKGGINELLREADLGVPPFLLDENWLGRSMIEHFYAFKRLSQVFTSADCSC